MPNLNDPRSCGAGEKIYSPGLKGASMFVRLPFLGSCWVSRWEVERWLLDASEPALSLSSFSVSCGADWERRI